MAVSPELPPLPKYSDRIITFIDLLGFSRDVQMLEKRPGLLRSIDSVLNAITNCKLDLDRHRENGTLHFDARLTQISDSVIASYQIENGAFGGAMSHAAFLGNICVRRGYLPRGVITIGKLVHDGDRLYGGGLVDAYNRERNSIVEPRIAIDARVLEQFRAEFAQVGQADRADSFIRNRGSGEFVHILGPDWPFAKKMAAEGDDGVPEMFDELRNMLPLRYKNAENDQQHQKIKWMADYVNDTIAERNLPIEWRVVLPDKNHP